MKEQIDEMAKIICAPTAKKGNCDKCGFKRHCSKFDYATDLYNAGYRKVPEGAMILTRAEIEALNAYAEKLKREFAKEIFAEINELKKQYASGDIDGNTLYVQLYLLEKKYTEVK